MLVIPKRKISPLVAHVSDDVMSAKTTWQLVMITAAAAINYRKYSPKAGKKKK